jgi:D-threo-aldose 1-dehydrogenase
MNICISGRPPCSPRARSAFFVGSDSLALAVQQQQPATMSYSVRSAAPTQDVYMIGCAPFGVDESANWNPFGVSAAVSDEQADATVAAALECGFLHFDTAPSYNNGVSESRLGHGLAAAGASDAISVWTKCGKLVRGPASEGGGDGSDGMEPDYTAEGCRLSFEESCERLGLEKLAGLRVHDPDDVEGGVDAALVPETGLLAEMVRLRESGKIGRVGLGMNANLRPDLILRLLQEAPAGTFDAALLAGGWNLLGQDSLPILSECERRGIAVHNAGVFATGYLVGGSNYLYDTPPPEIVAARDGWQALADKHGCSLPAVAMRFASVPSVIEHVLLGGCEIILYVSDTMMNHACVSASRNPRVVSHARGIILPLDHTAAAPSGRIVLYVR